MLSTQLDSVTRVPVPMLLIPRAQAHPTDWTIYESNCFCTALAILDRSRRHLHRHRRAPAGWLDCHAQAAFGKPGTLPRRSARRHAPFAWRRVRRGAPDRTHCRGENGHDRGHQCAAGKNGRSHRAVHHPGISRRAQDRLPEPAEDFRAPYRPARAALQQGGGGGGAHRRAATTPILAGSRPARCRRTARSWKKRAY